MLAVPLLLMARNCPTCKPTRQEDKAEAVEERKSTENPTPIDEAHLEAILKDPRSKAAHLKKIRLGEDALKDHHLVGRIWVAGFPTR